MQAKTIDPQSLANAEAQKVAAAFVQPIVEPQTPVAKIEPPVQATGVETKSEKDIYVPELDSPPKTEEAPPVDPDDDENAPPIAENFKKLRSKLKAERLAKQELESKYTETSEKLNDYETGKLIPEIVQGQESRIAQLEYYEKLHNLKMSPQYKDSFIKPLNEVGVKLQEIAKDYGVPDDVMKEALTLTNRAELNQFLSNHFDDIGGTEVKNLITKAQEIQTNAQSAEQKPLEALAKLQEEHREIETLQDSQRKEAIANTSKNSWGAALDEIKREGKARELIFNPNDSKYNDTFVIPVLRAASQEYGKLIRMLADSGLKVLDENVATMLSKTVLLAHASAVSINSREAAIRHAEELEINTKRQNGYNRPNVGGFGGGNSSPAPAAPLRTTPKEAASILVNSVLAKRGQ